MRPGAAHERSALTILGCCRRIARLAAARYQIGETFVQLSREALEARLAADEERISAEVRRLESDIEEIRSQMAVLKAKLYGKFKNSINLETDDA